MHTTKAVLTGILTCISGSLLLGQAVFETDRLGYTGTTVRYDSLADLESGSNAVDTIEIGNRDIYLGYGEGAALYVMGTWYYSTDPSGSAGWGNVTGNTGLGFIQLYDSDGSTMDAESMAFGGYDGTYWTEVALALSGSNANYDNEYTRFSTDSSSTNDVGVFLSYQIDLTIGGLQGTETSPGTIEAFNHPTTVLGTMNAVFQHTDDRDTSKNGFYAIELTFNMDNWAYENRDSLTYPETGFYDSYFAVSAVPEPATVGLLGIGGIGLILFLRRRRK